VPGALLADAAVAPLLNGTDHVELLRAALPQAAIVPMTVAVEATLLWRKLSFLAPLALFTTRAGQPLGPARDAHPDLLDALVAEAAAAAATAGAEIDPAAVGQRLRGLPAGMRSSMLKDAIAGATLELDAIAGPILRALPDGAPIKRAVVAEITEATARGH
jgi:2-dehydropantoate 2-reductase